MLKAEPRLMQIRVVGFADEAGVNPQNVARGQVNGYEYPVVPLDIGEEHVVDVALKIDQAFCFYVEE